MSITFDQNKLPKYFDKLSYANQEEYKELRKKLDLPSCRNRRNRSLEVFEEILELVKDYVIRGDKDDSIRSLVCGIMWLSNGIAINTHQLALMISKCKSSINGCFKLLGYETIPTAADSASEIIRKYPFLKNNFAELRKWTIRKKTSKSKNRKVEKHSKSRNILKKEINKSNIHINTNEESDINLIQREDLDFIKPNSISTENDEFQLLSVDIKDNEYYMNDFDEKHIDNDEIINIDTILFN